MPGKKKTPSVKDDGQGTAKAPGAKATGTESVRAAEVAPAFDAGAQLRAFEAAMKQFHERLETARGHLERAIQLEPRNRMIARQDADFGALARHPMFDSLLYPEKKGW